MVEICHEKRKETERVRTSNSSKSNHGIGRKRENVQMCPPCALLGADVLELLGAVHEVVGVCFGDDPALVRLLDKVLVALLVGEVDGIVLGLEVEVCALHEIGRGLPTHQGVLPAVTLAKDVPVHAPVVSIPVAGLSGRLCRAVDAEKIL